MSSKNPFAPSHEIKGRNAYGKAVWFGGVILCAVLACAGIAFSIPAKAGAFWPLSVAEAGTTSTPILHDASLNLLAAPVSSYVDDTESSAVISDDSALVSGVDYDGTTTPNETSSPADTEVDPTNTSGTISTYTVKPGDTLSQIAQNYGVSMNTILWANDITDQSTIKPGMTLVILPVSGIQHTVRSGETLSTIAAKYGGDAADIAQFNGISSDSALQVGSTIIIPGGEVNGSSNGGSKANTTTNTSSTKTSTKTTTSSKASETTSTETSTPKTSSSSSSGGSLSCDNSSGNPCHGIDGPALRGFFTNPLSGALVTQGLHGWDAVDLAAPAGTPIHAAADGTVILSRMGGWNGGYGNYVIVDNGQGVETLYAHMTQTKADVGESVSAGEVIGYVGMTGDATGNHLHFEVRGAQNPFAYCSEEQSDDSCFNP